MTVQMTRIDAVAPPNPTPIKWDPATMQAVPVSATLTQPDRAVRNVTLSIYRGDSLFAPVRTYQQNMDLEPGTNSIAFTWDGKDDRGVVMPKGVYTFEWGAAPIGKDAFFNSFSYADKTHVAATAISQSPAGVDDSGNALFDISYTIQFSTTLGGKLDVYDPDLSVVASQPLAPADMAPGPHTVRLSVPAAALGTRGQCTFLLCPQEMDTTKDQAYRALWVMQGGTAQKNDLHIVSTSPANPSPIKWDPDTMQTAPVSIFWQASTSAPRTVSLSIYDTKQHLIATLPNQTTPSATSGTATFAWDGTVDGSSDKAPAGLYLFKAEVKGVGGDDTDKSPYLQKTALDTDAELLSDDGTTAQYHVTYTLTSDPDRPASLGRVDVYAPDQTLAATQSLTADQLTSGTHTVTVTLLSPQLAGTYTFLVCPMDSHADLDAFGRTRYALQHNQQARKYAALNIDFASYPHPPPIGTTPHAQTISDLQKQPGQGDTGYAAEAHTNWTARQTWTALTAKDHEPALFCIFGHGGAIQAEDPAARQLGIYQLQTFWNGNTWSFIVQTAVGRDRLQQYFRSNNLPDPEIVTIEEECANGALPLKKLLVAAFIGCNTALDPSVQGPGTWGAPAQGAIMAGARAAIGFKTIIYSHRSEPNANDPAHPRMTPGAEEWCDQFWELLAEKNFTLAEAAKNAEKTPLGIVPVFQHLRSYVIPAGKDVTIHPAKSGDEAH